ncbi:UNVERIFIED_CONTAM: hypothetical protein PYX00_010641 [Menopon gallinae]|uniref:Coiled-coil domain-containing protein 22 homolog n=1 Tax=Menopon gallinae TaxID=328185 RepID=A0AAW2HGN7_9NEOP
MEEVDRIILHSLRQIGCDVDEEITSLKQFDSEMIVKAAVSCLDVIQPGLGLPKALPYNMAAKYRVGQDIAQACTDVGYPGDIGYQTFLYSGETDLRKVFMFLTEKLPKEQEKFVHEPSGAELFLRKIRLKIKEECQRPWIPSSCCSSLSSSSFLSQTLVTESPSAGWKEFWAYDLPTNSIKSEYLIPTLLTIHSRSVLYEKEPYWFEKKAVAEDGTEESHSPLRLSRESIQGKRKPVIAPKPKLIPQSPKEIDEGEEERRLKEEEEALTAEVEQLIDNIQQLQIKRNQIVQEIQKEEDTLSQKTQKDALHAQILKLLPDGENNILKLQQIVDSSAQRLVSCAAQWEKHRVPLFDKYRKIVQLNSSKKNEAVRKAETIKSLQEKRSELELELKNKDKILIQLKSENEKNGKEVNRSAYTRRIMEIIGNIEKQKTEIEKVLKDTREVQKEINNLTGQLERSFTIADETIFRDAKKNETSRRAYKLLATLHSDCDQLVEMVQETGAIVREIRDLEDQIEKEKSKNIAANLERITADLNQMKAESAQLTAQLKLKQRNS